MQFLLIAKQANPAPPEIVVPLIEAFEAWLAQHRASGKLKSAWAFAGTPGGGGVLEVDSHEDLDAIEQPTRSTIYCLVICETLR